MVPFLCEEICIGKTMTSSISGRQYQEERTMVEGWRDLWRGRGQRWGRGGAILKPYYNTVSEYNLKWTESAWECLWIKIESWMEINGLKTRILQKWIKINLIKLLIKLLILSKGCQWYGSCQFQVQTIAMGHMPCWMSWVLATVETHKWPDWMKGIPRHKSGI